MSNDARRHFGRRELTRMLIGGGLGLGLGLTRADAQGFPYSLDDPYAISRDWMRSVLNQSNGAWIQYMKGNTFSLEHSPDLSFYTLMGTTQQLRTAGLDYAMNVLRERPHLLGPGNIQMIYNAMLPPGTPFDPMVMNWISAVVNQSYGHESEFFQVMWDVFAGVPTFQEGLAGSYLAYWESLIGQPAPIPGFAPVVNAIYDPENPFPKCMYGPWPFQPLECIYTFPGWPQPMIWEDEQTGVGVTIPWYDPYSPYTPRPIKKITKADVCEYLWWGQLYASVILRVLTSTGGVFAVPEAGAVVFGSFLIMTSIRKIYCG